MATAPAKRASTRAATKDWTAAEAPAPAEPTWAPAAPPPAPFDEKQYALFLHLSALTWILSIPGFIGPLVLWLLKKDQSPFVDRHGRAAMDFQISVFIYALAAGLLIGVVAVVTLGIGVLLLIPVIALAAIAGAVLVIVFPILAGIKASHGQDYDYPLSLRILRQRPQ